MSRYGIDYYSLAFYGPPASSYYSSSSFTARSIKVGYIGIKWVSPYGDWSKVKLTRNSFGFPLDPWDGTQLDIKGDGSYVAFKETDPTYFDDKVGIATNQFYYYSLFVFENGKNKWTRAGNVIGLSSGDYKYTDKLYDSLPEIYKITSLGDPTSNLYNEDLYNFLSLFGFQLDLTHTYTNLLVNRYDTQKVGGQLIPAFMQQFGLQHEPEIGFQQERILLQNSVLINKARGSLKGLKDFLRAYSGYEVPGLTAAPNPNVDGVTVGHNLMLDYNDSSFEESVGHWLSNNGSASLYCLKNYNITKVALTSNVATLTIGNHNYQIGNKVYVKGCYYELFNATVTPVTITARTATTISYSLTGTNVAETNAYNNSTDSYPIVYPDPKCWAEPTALSNYPNKQKGILAVRNASTSAGTVAFACGADKPILKGIPVTEGLAYSFSVYSVAGSTTRTITAGISWYDRFGVLLSSSTGTGTSNATGQFSVRLKAENKVAPTGAAYAVPTISIASSAGSASNEWHYFDCAQFEQATAITAFDEARQLHITLQANRINELVNPNFYGTTSAAPWTVTGGTSTVINSQADPETTVYQTNYLTLSAGQAALETVVTSDLISGDKIYVSGVSGITNGVYTVIDWQPATSIYSSYVTFNTGGASSATRTAVSGIVYKISDSLEVTSSGTSVNVKSWDGVTNSQKLNIYYPSTEYTFSVYVRSSGLTDTATPSITWYDSSHVLISTSTGSAVTITAAPNGTAWNRPYVTAVAPATAAYATVSVDFATQNANTLILDAGLFENNAFVLPFFSGRGGPGDATSFMWEGGVANNSRSHYYKNFATVSSRLKNGALTDQVVLGTTYALYYAQPKT